MEPHPHDVKWLREQLGKLRAADKAKAAQEYQRVFAVTYAKSEWKTTAYGDGRRAANTWLREFVENTIKKY